MAPPIGFVLMTHDKPHQMSRLVTRLNHMFDYPPIVCHHDFSKSELPTENLTKNIALVNPHLQTGWGKFSLVEAMLRALQLMYAAATAPDWFVLLSGADYPIKPAKQIISDLTSSPYDVYIHHERISHNAYERDWQEQCYKRYCGVKLGLPLLKRKKHLTLTHPLLTSPFVPFSNDFHCFAGEFWFCANRKAANYLLKFDHERPDLATHYRKLDPYTICPEESYYQTIFGNASHLQVSQNNLRYVDWSAQGDHPKTLIFEDLPQIYASSAHFARKFDIDKDVRIFNAIDNLVG
jgi:hypothetical protein